jgi:hypothetical protein
MESVSPTLPNDQCVVLEPISKRAAFNVVGVYVLFILYGAWVSYGPTGNAGPDPSRNIIFLFSAGIFGFFSLYIADVYATSIQIDTKGIEKIGLFNRRVRIPWKEMKRIKLAPGMDYQGMPANSRVLVIGKATFFHPNKFEFFARHTIYLKRKNFWEAARLTVALADQFEVEIKGRGGFF